MMNKAILALALILGLAMSNAALACSCAPLGPPEKARDAADAVFSGKVLAVRPGTSGLEVDIRVEGTWKGVPCETVVVRTASDSAMCGYSFEEGKSYLIYAHRQQDALSTNLCTRTRPIDEAGEDLAALGDPQQTCSDPS